MAMNFRLGIAFVFMVCVAVRGHAEIAISEGLAPWQVLQRGPDDTATVTLKGTAEGKGEIWAAVSTTREGDVILPPRRIAESSSGVWQGTIDPLPTGGEYTVHLEFRTSDATSSTQIDHVLVGDIWLLLGQSNMVGVGELDSPLVEERSSSVHLFTTKRQWEPAVEPFHAIFESGDPENWEFLTYHERETVKPPFKPTMGGVGPGLYFGKHIARETGVPIGLIAAAHGGSRIEQWIAPESGGDAPLFSFATRSIEEAGGKIAGALWYQGETDALIAGEGGHYRQRMARLFSLLRETAGEPLLPIVYVQIGRFTVPLEDGHRGWWQVQEAQRQVHGDLSNLAGVGALDLPLNDTIHLSTNGQRLLGKRLAHQALRLAYGRAGNAPAPIVERVTTVESPRPMLRVHFQRESGPLIPEDAIPGFRIVDIDGKDQHLVYNAIIDPEHDWCVLLHVRRRLSPDDDLFLTYALDPNPAVSLANQAGQAALAFGPISLNALQAE